MSGLTPAQREFLEALARFDHPVSRSELARLADREEDCVRQSCRRKGLAEFVGGWIGGKKYPMGWRITKAGREALASLPAPLTAWRAASPT